MLNIFQTQKLSLKKIRFSKGKSLFVIIPISLMFTIIVVAASEAANLINVAHNSIFSPIQGQNEVIELNKSDSTNPRDMFSSDSSTGYTATDNTLISAISNIEKVSLVSELPIDNIKTDNIFAGKTINLTSLAGLDEEYAKLYTNESFKYTDGEAIPIILNANDFSEVYEDWQGKTTISVDFSASASTESSALEAQSPIKTKAVTYNRSDLIGKTITINFGGLDAISDIKQESTTTGYKYTQKTQDEMTTESNTRKTAISTYWNYDQISKPLSYTFVIAGISEGTDKTKAYIPTNFAKKLLQDYLSNEVSARNTTAMPTTAMNATYTGLVYDGVTLKTDSTSSIFAGIRNQVSDQVNSQIGTINSQIDTQNAAVAAANQQNRAAFQQMRNIANSSGGGDRPSGPPTSMPTFKSVTSSVSKLSASSINISYSGMAVSYDVPGLVYSQNRTSSEITGEYKSFSDANTAPLASSTLLIKLNSLDNRAQVVSDLNAKGYSYQDYSQYKQYDQLETYLYTILNVASIVFMAVTALFILINMAKFVSEGKKEIGIFRAIGATKGDIAILFITQSLSYAIVSIVFGAVIGIGVVYALGSLMVTSAQSFINTAVGSSVTLSQGISNSDFLGLNYNMILIYTGVLLIVTLVVSLIPSSQAARVSPVEAIRNS